MDSKAEQRSVPEKKVDDEKRFYSGDQCPVDGCDGKIVVYRSDIIKVNDQPYRRQYLWCRKCKHKPENNKVFFPAKYCHYTNR